VVIEILLFPGTMVLAFVGLGCLLVALVFSLQGFTLPDPKMPWQAALMRRNILTVLSSALGAGVLSMAAVRWLVPLLPFREGPYLTTTLNDIPSDLPTAPDDMVGKKGVVKTLLRPVGRVDVEGEEFHAVSSVGMLEPGSKVRVIGRRGTELLVELDA